MDVYLEIFFFLYNLVPASLKSRVCHCVCVYIYIYVEKELRSYIFMGKIN